MAAFFHALPYLLGIAIVSMLWVIFGGADSSSGPDRKRDQAGGFRWDEDLKNRR